MNVIYLAILQRRVCFSRESVIALTQKLEGLGLSGFLMVGWPGQPLLKIPVTEGPVGSVVIGGLNPAVPFLKKKA
jgi:repressor of nif and glnA expression